MNTPSQETKKKQLLACLKRANEAAAVFSWKETREQLGLASMWLRRLEEEHPMFFIQQEEGGGWAACIERAGVLLHKSKAYPTEEEATGALAAQKARLFPNENPGFVPSIEEQLANPHPPVTVSLRNAHAPTQIVGATLRPGFVVTSAPAGVDIAKLQAAMDKAVFLPQEETAGKKICLVCYEMYPTGQPCHTQPQEGARVHRGELLTSTPEQRAKGEYTKEERKPCGHYHAAYEACTLECEEAAAARREQAEPAIMELCSVLGCGQPSVNEKSDAWAYCANHQGAK